MESQQSIPSAASSNPSSFSGVRPPTYSKSFIFRMYLAAFASLLPGVLYCLTILVCLYYCVSFVVGMVSDGIGVLNTILLFFATSVLLFLIRPLFCVHKKLKGIVVDKQKEERLYALTHQLTETLNIAPMVKIEICEDVLVDLVYPSFQDFYKNRSLLRIGMPLIKTLSSVEFAALLAHELEHLVDPRVRKCYYLIRFMRSWFYKVVHSEDGWEAKIHKFNEHHEKPILHALISPLLFGISVVNKIFQMFLSFVEFLTSKVIFENEFLADELQAQITGSESFQTLLTHLVSIDQSYHEVIEKALTGREVPEDMADQISISCAKHNISPDQYVEMARAELFNGWHMLPPPIERVKRVASLDNAPLMSSDERLYELFSDANFYTKSVTDSFYEKHEVSKLGQPTKAESNEQEREPIPMEEAEKLIARFTSGLYQRDLIWEFPEADKFTRLPPEKIEPFLNKVVVSIRHSLPDFNKCMELREEYQKTAKLNHFYQWLVKDGSKRRPSADEMDKIKFLVAEFDNKHQKNIASYKKFYGVRVAAAVALGQKSKAYSTAIRIIEMLRKLSFQQAKVADAKIKCNTLGQLLKRQAEGETVHQKTVSRLTKMLLKVISDIEGTIKGYPPSLLGEGRNIDVMARQLDLDTLNGADYERLVIGRFWELICYFEAYNTAMSAKLVQFVQMVERKQNIESVVTVTIEQAAKAD